jgi:Cu(I)/Ag(I) efflux system membrane fusion protein
MNKIFNNRNVIRIVMLIAGIFLGWLFFSPSPENISDTAEHAHNILAEEWTCSMHPTVRQSGPGKCPICGMNLIPLESDQEAEELTGVKLSETAMKLANIQTTEIRTDQAVKEIRLSGKVQADERRISSQSAHIPGRIERLMVNSTGEYVSAGQVIAYIYSPELVTAQQELLEASKIRESQPSLYAAAREKLKTWKLTDEQIDKMLTENKSLERFPLLADVSGIVLERKVNVGDYVSRGMAIYDVADLSHLWLQFDVYESDLKWVKKNSLIEFTVESLPGEKFEGKISFIDPIINPKTRVAKARVEVTNPELKLKPEMFATGIVKTNLKGSGEIILPKSAVMWTGQRSIVYVKNTSDKGISFSLREVVLGPSLGDSYVIESGLESGVEVVTNGTFTIDAASQLAGKPSMMNPKGDDEMTGHQH